MSRVYDDRPCQLGEGPLWHPERQELFWFDILGRTLMSRDKSGPRAWAFDDLTSAAGWIDRDRLLVASESALWVMDLESGTRDLVTALEADNPLTRSNDGRTDPWGGFWIGTMGKRAEPGAGSIWRYYRGELRRLFPSITISNAISFSPDRHFGFFANSARKIVWKVALDPLHGWPRGKRRFSLISPAGKATPMARSLTPMAGCGWPNGGHRGWRPMAPTALSSRRSRLAAAIRPARPSGGRTSARSLSPPRGSI